METIINRKWTYYFKNKEIKDIWILYLLELKNSIHTEYVRKEIDREEYNNSTRTLNNYIYDNL